MEGTYDELRVSNLSFTNTFPSTEIETIEYPEKEFDTSDEKTESCPVSNGPEPIERVESSFDEKKNGETRSAPVETAETRGSGHISKTIYWLYISAGGTNCKILFFIVTCIFTQILVSGGDLWMSYWYLPRPWIELQSTVDTPLTVFILFTFQGESGRTRFFEFKNRIEPGRVVGNLQFAVVDFPADLRNDFCRYNIRDGVGDRFKVHDMRFDVYESIDELAQHDVQSYNQSYDVFFQHEFVG